MTTPLTSVPARKDPITGKVKPLVGLDLTGFEPIILTIAKRRDQPDADVVETHRPVMKKVLKAPPVE